MHKIVPTMFCLQCPKAARSTQLESIKKVWQFQDKILYGFPRISCIFIVMDLCLNFVKIIFDRLITLFSRSARSVALRNLASLVLLNITFSVENRVL